MTFDPFWLLAAAVAVLSAYSAWTLVVHGDRLAAIEAPHDHPHEHDQYVELAAGATTNNALETINARLDQVRLDLEHTNQRIDEHSHPHSHDQIDYHVHWYRYNSTETTNGIARDVYVCGVPGCSSVISHTPE